MRAEIRPGIIEGKIRIPGSKSIGHRMLILAALSEGKTVLENLPMNEDIRATMDCLKAFGADICEVGNRVTVEKNAGKLLRKERILPCRESGSTLRFLIPAALDGVPTLFTGSERLFDRPLSVYEDLCREKGFYWEKASDGLHLKGKLEAGSYRIPGNISSQFMTGLLLALPWVKGNSRIEISAPAESTPYIEMTLTVLRQFSVAVHGSLAGGFEIPGEQKGRSPGEISIPGDESGAAFFGGMNLIGHRLTLEGLQEDFLQGDAVWRSYFKMLEEGNQTLSVRECPDLAPILAVAAACKHGAVLTDTARLSYKESDRGQAVKEELARCGVDVSVEENRIIIPGGRLKSPESAFQSHNDHRIAMAMAVLATKVGGTVEGAEAVSKSMPEFWQLLKEAGAKIDLA